MPQHQLKNPPNPAKTVAIGFAVTIAVGTLLLLLPAATPGPGGAPFRDAIFTATSAVCVTGLTVVDTATYWSPFGQAILMGLMQVGGLGIMTGAALVFLAVSKRIGLRNRMIARQERGSVNLGDVRKVLRGVVIFSLTTEIVVAIVLTVRLVSEGETFAEAAWHGAFHSISAFNNAGFALYPDNLTGFASDTVVLVVVAGAVLVGSLGFPVWVELMSRWRKPDRWSLHTKLTIGTSLGILLFGWVLYLAFEWANEATLGPMSIGDKVLTAGFASASRTAGFNTVDYAQMSDQSVMVTNMVMFAGGGSGSVAGGIKVTTFAVLLLAAVAEFRGAPDVTAYGRRITATIQRQALAVAFAAVNVVVLGALILMVLTPHGFRETLFETISAFATVGFSLGITDELSAPAEAVLIGLMYFGRVGILTLAVAILLRRHPRRFTYPEERPLVG